MEQWCSYINVIQYYHNTLRLRQNGHHFEDDVLKCIFLNENISISIKIALKFDPKAAINNSPSLVQIMAWRRPGDKSLYEPMMVTLLMHIYVNWPQWVNCTVAVIILPTVHYTDVIMGAMASQITSLTIVYSTIYSGADQGKHQSSVSLAFVWGIHRDRWIPRTKGQ